MKSQAFLSAIAALAIGLLAIRSHADSALPDLPIVSENLTLQGALKLASSDNVAIQQANVDAATAIDEARSAEAQTKPSVATTIYGLLGDSNNIVASSPGVMPENYLGVSPHGFFDQNIILMAPLYTGGTLSGAAQAANAQGSAAELTAGNTQITTQESVVDAYVKVLLQGSLVDVAQSRLDAENEQLRVTQQEVNVGHSAPLDLLREQAEDSDAKQGLLSAQTDEAVALVDLKTALGISQSSQITLTDTLDTMLIPNTLLSSLQEAIQTAEANRPDLAAALKQLDAAKDSLHSAQGAYSPQVYALGMTDVSSTSNVSSRVGYTVGLTASIPLYDGGQRSADIDASKSRLTRATLDAQSVRQTIDQDVATAWLDLQTSTQQIQTAQTGVNAAQQAYDLATLRYNAGKSIDADRLDALTALTRAKADLANAKATAIDAHVRLIVVMGK